MSDLEVKIREIGGAENLLKIIHYACESFFIVKDRPVKICCIAIIEVVFSLTDYQGNSEESLLNDFYKYLSQSRDGKYIHWNMNSSEFGFEAIDKRFKYITGNEPPYKVPNDNTYDLDEIIEFSYGDDFSDHPKMSTLAVINGFKKRHFLSGKEESEKFENGEFGDIKRSTTEKTRAIKMLLDKFRDGSLETKHSGPKIKFAGEKIDAVKTIIELSQRFKVISRQLKKRHAARPTLEINDEYDFQDLFNTLLKVFFDDVRAEEWTPSYAGGNKRTDFLLPEFGTAIELKHSRPTMSQKDLGDQLVIDIENYKQHPSVRIIVCLVIDYDGYILNPTGIERDVTYVKDKYSVITKILV
jgi:REase_DpnII-MboI